MPEGSQAGFFSLLIPADLAELHKARLLMAEVGQQAGLPEPRIFDLQVTVSEATANAIEHAASEVQIEAWLLPDRVIVEVTNDGLFQPGLVKNEDTRRRGLGLPLMVSLADQVHVLRLPGSKTRVSVTFFLEGYRPQIPGPDPAGESEMRSGEVENLYRNLAERSPYAILVHIDGTYVFANPEAAKLFGARSPDELIGLKAIERLHPDDRELAIRRVSQVLGGDIAPPTEGRMLRLDGTPFFAESTGSRVNLGGRLAVQVIIRDITERKRGAEDLRRSEERFRTMVDAIPQLAWIANADGYIHWYNRRWYEYTGTTLEEMEGWGWQSVHDPEALPAVLANWRESIATGQPFDMEFPLRGSDGKYRPFLTRVMPQKDASGRVVQWFGTNTDLSERQAVQEARRRSEESAAGLLTSMGKLRLFERRKAWQVLLVGTILQVILLVGVDQLGSPSRYLGIPGAGAALVGVMAAISAGPIIGILTALAGGAVYFVFITDIGGSVAWPAIVISILLWTLAAAVAGFAAEWVRHNALEREGLLARMLADRATLAGSLAAVNTRLGTRNEELARHEQELLEAHAETARLLDEQALLFQRLQESLLDIPKELSGVKFAHLYRSATAQAKVGGDFYDVFEAKGGRIGILIGDVSGHGLEAARVATLVKDIVQAFAHQFRRPHLVLRETNRLLVEKRLPGFVTAFVGFLDPSNGSLIYSSAGHPPPLLGAEGRVGALTSGSLPLGVFPDARYRDTETQIPEGSLLLFYTDGITEARRNGDLYGEARLAQALERACDRPVDEVPSCLLKEALDFSSGALADDVALLAISYPGPMNGGALSEVE